MSLPLRENRSLDFGARNDKLSDGVIDYILYCFSTALAQTKGDPEGLSSSLGAIAPHAFGSHENCGAWCGYIKDSENYKD